MQEPDRQRSSPSRSNGEGHSEDSEFGLLKEPSAADDWHDELSSPALPQRGFQYAMMTGAVGGILGVLLNVAITLLNSPTFQRANSEGANLTYNTALTLAGLACLNFFVSLLICFFVGFIVGRIAVRRRLGFYAGMLAGAIMYLAAFFTRYVPNYPGNLATNAPVSAGLFTGGVVVSLVFLLIWAIIGGAVSLWGAWTATRKHVYYLAQ